MQGLQGTEDAARAWMAWPPPGVFPLQAYGEGRRSLGETGWSLQSDYIDLDGASVSVSSNGTELEVAVNRLEGTTGSRNALRFVPQGWTVSAGSTYTVRVTGIEPPLEYDVTLADCG